MELRLEVKSDWKRPTEHLIEPLWLLLASTPQYYKQLIWQRKELCYIYCHSANMRNSDQTAVNTEQTQLHTHTRELGSSPICLNLIKIFVKFHNGNTQ